MYPGKQRLSEAALGDDHLYPLASPLDSFDSTKNPMQRDWRVVVRSRVSASDDATFRGRALQADDSVDDGGVHAALIEHDVTLFDWVLRDRLKSDDVAVFDGGTHAASAHTQLNGQAAGK